MTFDRARITEQLGQAASWEAKNRLLVQIARELPALDDADRDDAHRVHGCESGVWMSLDWRDDRLTLRLDSDSRVVRGLLVLVLAAFHGRSADDILSVDFAGWLAQLGLARFLTSSRANGLKAIVDRVRDAASRHLADRPARYC
ncbi:SufE family protein [Chitiniphilus eburneus]|uniref:SufE family protein n=1 Tax=Chitiniphilus eburneus TaxID=2571148 RepID=UPI00145CE42E|nr:SufE family protein [Chitiniphilus eburneus]